MGKNNYSEVQRKMVRQRQRFSLRKLSVGVTSVMLGVTFFAGQGMVAHADSSQPAETSVATTEQPVQANSDQEQSVALDQPQVTDDHASQVGHNKDQQSESTTASPTQSSQPTVADNKVVSRAAAADPQNQGQVTTTYYDKFTNQQLGWMSAIDGETTILVQTTLARPLVITLMTRVLIACGA
jgi:cytoskeletal protein RodZ